MDEANLNIYRLSGLLWANDPEQALVTDDCYTDHYDHLAEYILDADVSDLEGLQAIFRDHGCREDNERLNNNVLVFLGMVI